MKAYEQALRIDSENEEALFGLGINYSRMRSHSNAIEAYKKVIEINPKHAQAHFELGVSYDRTNHLSYAFEQYKILKTLDERLADKLYHIILGS
ncbi:MAG: tetratricopeptide repeat protein [Proteobacteria bacterium]|nr:tetratricopeptide repeat protein [Pseudomonadota bacterium]